MFRINQMAHNLPRLFLPQRKLRLVAQAHRKRPAPETAHGNHLQRHAAGKAQIRQPARHQGVEFAEHGIGDNGIDMRNCAFAQLGEWDGGHGGLSNDIRGMRAAQETASVSNGTFFIKRNRRDYQLL